MNDILLVQNLVKKYGDFKAVNDISFKIKKGTLFALLGPNGAGKSTTVKMITKMLYPNSGQILLNDKTDDTYFRNNIGVVFQENILDDLLSVKENLLYRASLYIKDNNLIKRKYKEIVSFLKLNDIENKRYKLLSGGQNEGLKLQDHCFQSHKFLY